MTTHRPASARVRAWCHRSRDPSAGRDREPVCESHDSTGEPGAGNRPAGFGERGEETCPRESACGPVAKAPDEPPIPLPATRLPSTLLPFSFRVAWVLSNTKLSRISGTGCASDVEATYCDFGTARRLRFGRRGIGHRQTRAGTRVRGAGVQAVSPAQRGRSGATRLDGGERTRDSQQNRGQTHGVPPPCWSAF